MGWNERSGTIETVGFYRMHVASRFGRVETHQGAVVFGGSKRSGCEVLRVLTPAPSPELLYQELHRLHERPLKERLVFHDIDRDSLMGLVRAFCEQGAPLPDIFDAPNTVVEGLSVFQQTAYRQACKIPHGETRSYAWLAERIHKSGAERAVGGAMKSNPFPLLIPCHRVLKKDGNLGGFMGTALPESWQLGLKRALLEVESLHRQPSLFSLCGEPMVQ